MAEWKRWEQCPHPYCKGRGHVTKRETRPYEHCGITYPGLVELELQCPVCLLWHDYLAQGRRVGHEMAKLMNANGAVMSFVAAAQELIDSMTDWETSQDKRTEKALFRLTDLVAQHRPLGVEDIKNRPEAGETDKAPIHPPV